MSRWKTVFVPEAKDDLDKLTSAVRERVIEKLAWLEHNFDNITPLTLGAKWQGFFKIRIGDWRAIYRINWDAEEIVVVVVRHRSEVYRRKPRTGSDRY